MRVAAVAASPAAMFVGGLLAGAGRLHATLTVEEVTAELEALRGTATCWEPAPYADASAMDERLRQLAPRLARWRTPGAADLGALAAVLDDAWQRVALRPGPTWADAALRVEVASIDDARELHGIGGIDGWRLAPHVSMHAGRVSWTWPLVVTADAILDDLRGNRRHDRLYRLVDPPGADAPGERVTVDVAIVHPDSLRLLDRVEATVAVLLEADGPAIDQLLDRATTVGLAGVLVVPGGDAGLLDAIVAELAHDEPLDVAAALVAPGATLFASAELLGLSSIRFWAGFVAARLGDDAVGRALDAIARTEPFDRELRGAQSTVAAVAGLAEDALRAVTTIRLDMAAAAPPPSVGADLGEPGDGDHLPLAPAVPREFPPLADERRLQARVSDASGTRRRDGFVAGEQHQLRVRIAAGEDADAIVADATFVHPAPGQEVELTVRVRRRGSTARPVRRKLVLPASADSAWTTPIPLAVPVDAASVAVEIVVLHEGRAVQTAVLSGPVIAAGAPAAGAPAAGEDGLRLSVDADTPPGELGGRASSPATFLVSVGLGGQPDVIDLSASGRALPADRLEKANQAVRRILLDAFMDPPADLRAAAGVLTKLAVRGATLRNHLRGTAADFHDDDPWVHVISFGDGSVPFELIYTHELPDSDDEVPVCDSALAGATECTVGCADRQRSDRVCPYGFWATSKVVERRTHVDARTRTTAGPQRQVAVVSGAVVGVSKKADEEDTTSSARIATAVAGAVPPDRFHAVRTWKELSEAVGGDGRPGVLVLVTHTIKPVDAADDLGVALELGGDTRPAHRIDDAYVNPGLREPGPVVVSLGCDTGDLDVGYADWVGTLHAAGAEVVVSTLSPVPGKEVATFIERMFTALPQQLAGPPPHRFGALLTAVRRATIATGDVLALSVTASGDGDIELIGAP